MSARILQIDLQSYNNNFELLNLLPNEITRVLLQYLIKFNEKFGNNQKILHFYLVLMRKFGDQDSNFEKITQ